MGGVGETLEGLASILARLSRVGVEVDGPEIFSSKVLARREGPSLDVVLISVGGCVGLEVFMVRSRTKVLGKRVVRRLVYSSVENRKSKVV